MRLYSRECFPTAVTIHICDQLCECIGAYVKRTIISFSFTRSLAHTLHSTAIAFRYCFHLWCSYFVFVIVAVAIFLFFASLFFSRASKLALLSSSQQFDVCYYMCVQHTNRSRTNGKIKSNITNKHTQDSFVVSNAITEEKKISICFWKLLTFFFSSAIIQLM